MHFHIVLLPRIFGGPIRLKEEIMNNANTHCFFLCYSKSNAPLIAYKICFNGPHECQF